MYLQVVHTFKLSWDQLLHTLTSLHAQVIHLENKQGLPYAA